MHCVDLKLLLGEAGKNTWSVKRQHFAAIMYSHV